MKLGETFLNKNPSSPTHLWIIVTNEDDKQEVVMFNFTSWFEGCDESCVVEAGEHPFIKKKSIIAYQRGGFFSDRLRKDMEKTGVYQSHKSVSNQLLKKIQNGALISKYTPNKFIPLIKNSLK